ncbi:iron ABC transporter permease [Aurantimonas sp. HBX-1]|uniref:ABC transporter permease n=1 Tax=Aurantimonas sp. HBX-1 TaxID=2906072 RepID=UPI001F283956|nr:iron ABC transporter permease [Aurantimonas sp. HBX-1]UIJ72941.1 iron ABC transporter permease [Aurantimonas sp. HBX-1]
MARLAFEAFVPGGTPDLANVRSVLTARSTWTATWNSLVTATLGTALSLGLGTLFALLVALTDIRGKAALVFCFLLPLMIPPQVTALSWAQLAGPASPLLITLGLAPPLGASNPLYSAEGIVLLLGIQHAPLVFLAVRAGLRGLPREMIEAARACGAKRLRVMASIVLPMMTPPLVAGGALAFVSAVGNFGIPALLGIPAGFTVLPTLIYQRLASFGPSIISDVAVLSIVVGALAFVGFAVQALVIGKRDYRSVGAPSQALRYALGLWRLPAEILAWTIIVAILVVPLAALLATSLVTAYGVPLTVETVTLGNYAEVLLRQDATIRAFRNSFLLAAGASLVLMAVCVPFAAFIVWRRSRFLDAMAMTAEVPYALPGIVLGVAAILLFVVPLPLVGISLYNTIWIIFFAYLARFLTLSLRPVIGAVQQTDRALEEAARMAGARYWFRLRTVILPLLAPAAAAGAILTFMTSFNELTVSALLWSAGNETLGVVVFNLDDSGATVLASAVAAVTVVAIVAIMGVTALAARKLPRGVLPWAD